MTQPRDTADVIGSRGTAATADTGLLTGNVPTADELSMVGETVNYTGANFQPDTPDGLGITRRLRNQTGGTIVSGGTATGDNVREFTANSTGAAVALGALNSLHVYESIMLIDINDNEFGDFTRIA
tara:strand:- start:402 stop:779 length:378 start_codon:yes stop_codon:yes gene_type:complete